MYGSVKNKEVNEVGNSCCTSSCIDWKLLPIKLHFFLFYGATGCIISYIQLLAKQIGLSATAVGIAFTVQPFLILFSKPIFGTIVDHFKNLKAVMAVLITLTSVSYLVVPFIPPVGTGSKSDSGNTSFAILKCHESICRISDVSSGYDRRCLEQLAVDGHVCHSAYYHVTHEVLVNDSSVCFEACDVTIDASKIFKTNISFSEDLMALDMQSLTHASLRSADAIHNPSRSSLNSVEKSYLNVNYTMCECSEYAISLRDCNPGVDACSNSSNDGEINIYTTYQFWTFSVFATIAGTTSATMFCLSDAACCEALGDDTEKFGKQRMWATLSWGSISFLTGYLNDLASKGSDKINYFPGFYLMVALTCLDLIVLCFVKITSVKFSTAIWRDVGRIFASSEIVCFAMGVFIVGGLTGMLWNYKFWYLQDLGASQLLLGLTVGVQCLCAEMPFFFLSGYIIKTFGHFNCLIGSFIAFTLRFSLYALLQDPWYTLPIELLHGMTYAVFYASMTSYAKTNAPPGTEVTMLGILGGLFEGLGVAVGGLLTGVGYDEISGRFTFFAASVVSGLCAVSFILIRITVRLNQW